MSYEDRAGITEIREDKRDRLSISRDTGWEGERIAVLLHIPDVDHHDHSHIELNDKQVKILHEWLGKYLEDKWVF